MSRKQEGTERRLAASFYLTESMIDWVHEEAARHGVTRSEVVMAALQDRRKASEGFEMSVKSAIEGGIPYGT